jgi:hypothetical protein
MLQLAPRGEIAVPMFKLEAPQLRDVKTEQFCWGSKAAIASRSRQVRFTPDSGHSSVHVGCPKSARSGPRCGMPPGGSIKFRPSR